jgi:hypothetical protein
MHETMGREVNVQGSKSASGSKKAGRSNEPGKGNSKSAKSNGGYLFCMSAAPDLNESATCSKCFR